MKLNKKGFTLVELLAVIVILAVVMLVAVTAVGPAIENSKRSALFSSLSAVQDAAGLYIVSGGNTNNNCVKINTLQTSGYLTKKDKNLDGFVKITKNATTGAFTYSYTAKDSNYGVTNATLDEIGSDGKGNKVVVAANVNVTNQNICS